MADTLALSKIIEPFVRDWLRQEYKQEFESHDVALTLTTGGLHRFDAVSIDRSIVADIKSSFSFGAGSVHSVIVDLYYLNLITAEKKFLVLTDLDFFNYFMKRMEGKIASGIKVLPCELPPKIKEKIKDTQLNAQREIGKK